MNFYDNQLPECLHKALARMKFEKATPIQSAAIPPALQGHDLIGIAQTGTGKTAAFAIPLVAQLTSDQSQTALILAPTRELAAQIHEVVLELSRFAKNFQSTLVVGGASMGKQLRSLRQQPNIIIATPGRLMDHIRRRSVDLSNTSKVVLDEADRMLDMGFGPQIEEISRHLPTERQTLLFSATLPPKIKKLAESLLNNPRHIVAGSVDRPAERVEQSHIRVEASEKSNRLLQELSERSLKTLIFTRTKRGADKLNRYLEKNGVKSACIHGDRSQSQRERAIASFRAGRTTIMVATDVASRGLDVDQIKLVINYDLPETAEDYIHRIGRTGRAGESGAAISFVSSTELGHWQYLQNPKSNRKQNSGKRFRRSRQRAYGSRRDSFRRSA